MTDKILIAQIDCPVRIGVTVEERSRSQRLSIDVEFSTDSRKAAATDSITDAIDYGQVASIASRICASREFQLIETVAEMIAERVLRDFPTPRVRVLVRKISPLADPVVSYVSVEIIRP